MGKSKQGNGFSIGDWVVHRFHGVGRVSRVERKELGGEASDFFRVEGDETIYWIPVEDADNERIRPLVTKNELHQAIQILSTHPRQMEQDFRKRQIRIKSVKMEGSLISICKIVRDLVGRKREKGLNESEAHALRFFKELLLNEWAICVDATMDDVTNQFHQALNASITG